MERAWPLWIRLIIEFLGTFVLVTVAAGSCVINAYFGGSPISRVATVIAPGAVVMAMIYTWGPLSGCTSMPRSPPVSRPAGSSRRAGLCRTGWLSSPGRSALPCSCRRCSVTSPRVGVPDLQARRGLAGIRHRDRHDGPGRFCCIASTPGRSVAGHLAMATGIDLRRRTRSHHGRGSGRVVVHGCVGFPRQ